MPDPIPAFEAPRWFACHTKSRCEKKFAALMAEEGFEHYLPLMENRRVYAYGERLSLKPVFPGYVFTLIAPSRRHRTYQQDYLARVIWIEDQAAFLRQLDAVRRIVDSGIKAVLRPLVRKGVRVKIRTGPFSGIEGYIEKPESPRGVLIAVDILRQGLLVEIPLSQLKILH